jgi:chromosome segregation ATPase
VRVLTCHSTPQLADQQQRIAAQAEQIRLLKLEVLVHEDEEKRLNDFLDDARRDYEVANSERLNALSERFALDEEIRTLSNQLDRVEAEKANYARRMHETLFMNQALRANNDQLKQELVVLGMEKDKVIAEKQGLQEQVEGAQAEAAQIQERKAQVDKELTENQRKQGHLEARLQSMKEQYDIEVEHGVGYQQEIVRLTATINEERVQVGVLEAKCNLLSAEKQNTGMRVQDKLRIERLLNQKLELEAIVEASKLDRKRDEEQIYTLRASLEALDTEMQHNKRVYSTGQQAFLYAERTCEQLRQQTQELEKNYQKAQKKYVARRRHAAGLIPGLTE